MFTTLPWPIVANLPPSIEYTIIFIILIMIHRWLKEDAILYKKVVVFATFFIFVHIMNCTILSSLLQCIAPVFFIAVFLLHYKSITRKHLTSTYIFADEMQKKSLWINDSIKALLYAHYAEKKMTLYIMRDDIAYSLFMHIMPIHMPLIYNFMIMLIEGNSKEISLLIDCLGHIRSINPHYLNSDYLLLKNDTFLSCTFEENSRAFTVTHANKKIVGLSATHAAHFIQKLLDENDTSKCNDSPMIFEKYADKNNFHQK